MWITKKAQKIQGLNGNLQHHDGRFRGSEEQKRVWRTCHEFLPKWTLNRHTLLKSCLCIQLPNAPRNLWASEVHNLLSIWQYPPLMILSFYLKIQKSASTTNRKEDKRGCFPVETWTMDCAGSFKYATINKRTLPCMGCEFTEWGLCWLSSILC